ncbi:hypothetical protein ElyMa_000135500 [Elysia marginata]|uniref:Uncharacterized protein n=1 Tax=Elysia marginata TaxID=1093978 RepID=A0AAV4EPK7_9GAST|nr:hypothetical protein ElyMa_000135500 [Elysia marginata]
MLTICLGTLTVLFSLQIVQESPSGTTPSGHRLLDIHNLNWLVTGPALQLSRRVTSHGSTTPHPTPGTQPHAARGRLGISSGEMKGDYLLPGLDWPGMLDAD